MSFYFQNHVEEEEDGHGPSLLPYAGPRDVSHFLMGAMSSGPGRASEFQPEDDLSDDGYQIPGEKKRRLGPDQVKALEKSFESGNKLEPERKVQLARALGLQPRQIAIWFQNRRARWKTKRLEKDYDALKKRFEALKNDNNALKSQNKKLHSQLMGLKNRGPAVSEPVIDKSSNVDHNKNDVVDNLIEGQRIDYTNQLFSSVEENYNYQDFFGLGMDTIINFQ